MTRLRCSTNSEVSKACLLLYYSFTGQAQRAVESAADSCRSAGWDPTICAIQFADRAKAPSRPFTVRTAKYWTDAAQRQDVVAVCYDPPAAIAARYDFVIVFSNTWGGSPAVPIRSFLDSEVAPRLLAGTAFGVIVVCRRLWRKNAAIVRELGEAAGGRFVASAALTHWGGQLGSLIQTVTYLLRADGGRKRALGIPLPRYGLSDISMETVPLVVKRMLGGAG